MGKIPSHADTSSNESFANKKASFFHLNLKKEAIALKKIAKWGLVFLIFHTLYVLLSHPSSYLMNSFHDFSSLNLIAKIDWPVFVFFLFWVSETPNSTYPQAMITIHLALAIQWFFIGVVVRSLGGIVFSIAEGFAGVGKKIYGKSSK